MKESKKVVIDKLGNIYVMKKEDLFEKNNKSQNIQEDDFDLKAVLKERAKAKEMLESVKQEKNSVEGEILKLMENLFGISGTFEDVNNPEINEEFEESIFCMNPFYKEQNKTNQSHKEKTKGCPFIKAEKEECGCVKCECSLSSFIEKEEERDKSKDAEAKTIDDFLLSSFGLESFAKNKQQEDKVSSNTLDKIAAVISELIEGENSEKEYCNCFSCEENDVLKNKAEGEKLELLKNKLKRMDNNFVGETITQEDLEMILENFEVEKKSIEFKLDGESYTIFY